MEVEQMADIQAEIELLQNEIQKANAVISKAINNRRAIGKDHPLAAEANAAVAMAREALAAIEIKLRTLYESKPD
jgi:hypothetical protein